MHHDTHLLILQITTQSPLFPYTTLFRSVDESHHLRLERARVLISEGLAGHKAQPAVLFRGDVVDGDPLLNDEFSHVALLPRVSRSEEHTSELQSRENLVCRLLLEKKKKN